MPERSSSRTALGTAYMRAAHQLLEAAPHILEDPIALRLLGAGAQERILSSSAEYQSPARRSLRAHVVLRSRYAEDRLAAAFERGVRQYVLLGAGFDSFALRQPDWAQALQIFEVDHAASQAQKRERIASAGLSLPENVHFASIDFEHESLCEALRRSALAFDRPAFFSWLGVTMYLHEDAIDAVLSCVAGFPAGSEIVLTYAPPGEQPSHFEQQSVGLGEPWISFFEPQALEAKLKGAGFSSVEFLPVAQTEALYFRPRPQDLQAPQRTNLVSAIR